MQVFAIFDVSNPDRIRGRIKTQFSEYYDCGTNSFFVADTNKTTQQIAESVGLDQERGIVMPVTSFWGYHDSELWEWIGIKLRTNVQQTFNHPAY